MIDNRGDIKRRQLVRSINHKVDNTTYQRRASGFQISNKGNSESDTSKISLLKIGFCWKDKHTAHSFEKYVHTFPNTQVNQCCARILTGYV